MSIVARKVLRERAEAYVAQNTDATVPEVLGRFLIDPSEDSEERALIEDVLASERESAPRDADGRPEAEA